MATLAVGRDILPPNQQIGEATVSNQPAESSINGPQSEARSRFMESHPTPIEKDEFSRTRLPELVDLAISLPDLEQLLGDVEVFGELPEVIPKFRAKGYVPETPSLTLAQAGPLLRNRTVRGLQLRYRFNGADWWDTIMVVGEIYRLVRIRREF